MTIKEEIKSIVIRLGADKCGIASIDRFSSAPEGFHPTDVYSKCKSVIVFLKRMPPEVIIAENPIPYSHTAYLLYSALDQIGLKLCSELGNHGINVLPVPTDVPYLHWDTEKKHGMGIISIRHAAFNAGLGILGRNTLLINREYGNMVYIGAVLLDTEVEPDPIVNDLACPPNCRLCIEACPVQALDGVTVIQKQCREFSSMLHPRGWEIYTCNACRKVCPLRNGKN
ncbi:MAG TPA: epoxyqueuosine reductase [Candidatus Cloacimonadota bacterium]|nr:epoxyqueuosine reductase [Candidatus Cloacimonadota bacterium]